MKKLKSIISILLTLIIMLSVVTTLHLNSFSALEPTEVESSEEASQPSQEQTQPPTVITTETEATQQTDAPTAAPTDAPTDAPTAAPTDAPTDPPTDPPTAAPTKPQPITPTQAPTFDSSTIGSVGSIKKEFGSTNELKLSWNVVKGATGYRIYYKNNDIHDNFRMLTSTKGTKITLKNLAHTTPYEFKITPYVVKYGKLYLGDSVVAKTGTEPANTNKPTLKRSSTLIEISWNKNTRADGYRIYRQDASTNGRLVLYKTITNNATTSFEDTNVNQGRAYNYHVKAYREMYDGVVYLGKGETLRTLAGLSAPGHVGTTSQLRRVSMVWNKNTYAQGYDVMYSSSKSGPYTLLKSTSNNFLNTPRLTTGKKYYFRVVPYRQVGNYKVTGTYLPIEKTISDKAYGKTIGNTYIEISIKQQHMWYYIDGNLYVETDVVTGNVGYYSTPTGAYSIYQRLSPATLTGPTWSSYVQYWMAFTYSGCGIHDASWRSASEYGGTTYMGNGSHGCVNTPLNAVKKIYGKAGIGTPVVVY